MEKIKAILSKDKKTSNLIFIGVLLVIVLIFMDYIFIDGEKQESAPVISKEVVEETLDTKLARIINQISGVDSSSVLITYSSTHKIIPVYDTKEDVNTSIENGKTSTKKTVEKTVAYEGEENNAIVESTQNAQATGAVVVVTGNITDSIKLQIKEAIAVVTNVPVHKIQIFVN